MKIAWPFWVAAIAAALAFSFLGRWQLGRAEQKEAQLAENAAVLAQRQTVPLATAVAQDTRALRWVEGEGEFVAAPTLWLDNQRRGAQVGVRMFCAFRPRGATTLLLLDLGWIALPGDRRLPAQRCPDGSAKVRGLLAAPPSPGLALGAAVPATADGAVLLTRIEVEALASSLSLPAPLQPLLLRLDPALPWGYARDLELLSNTLPPEKHRGYALQWFGLAVLAILIPFLLRLRRR